MHAEFASVHALRTDARGALGATSTDVSFLSICKHALGFAKLREGSEATRE